MCFIYIIVLIMRRPLAPHPHDFTLFLICFSPVTNHCKHSLHFGLSTSKVSLDRALMEFSHESFICLNRKMQNYCVCVYVCAIRVLSSACVKA